MEEQVFLNDNPPNVSRGGEDWSGVTRWLWRMSAWQSLTASPSCNCAPYDASRGNKGESTANTLACRVTVRSNCRQHNSELLKLQPSNTVEHWQQYSGVYWQGRCSCLDKWKTSYKIVWTHIYLENYMFAHRKPGYPHYHWQALPSGSELIRTLYWFLHWYILIMYYFCG